MKKGFSLIELAIVLIIVGIVVGGLVAAKSMMQTAKLQGIVSDWQKYASATNNYFTKYSYWPGDDFEANARWGTATSGTGDGALGDTASSNEYYYFWQDLSLAGFITGNFSGTNTTTGTTLSVPKTTLQNTWMTHYYDSAYPANQAFYIVYSTTGSSTASTAPSTYVLNGSDALSIDTKIDDGLPNQQTALTGNVISVGSSTNCASAGAAGTYATTTTTPVCNLYYIYKK